MIPMSNVEYILGDDTVSNMPYGVFDDRVCAFLNDFSTAILKSPDARLFPEIATLAFWCRKGNIEKLKNAYSDRDSRMGRGLSFHISPSNVPINFAFSFVFSLLAGNANIVRLPSKQYLQIDVICEQIRTLFVTYKDIARRTAFVRYPVDNAITEKFSMLADIRMIWGGDQTVAEVKKLSTKPRVTDLYFSDRYSVCLIDAEAVETADAAALQRLAQGFYNDTFLMDQNACSSPQIILWKNSSLQGREKFWSAVMQVAAAYTLQDAVVVDKYTKLCEESIVLGYVQSAQRQQNLIYRIELEDLPGDVVNNRGQGGYFYEFSLSSYAQLFNIVTEKFQTITYFGIDAQDLRKEMIAQHVRGIDRIVPVGKAVDMGIIWDGQDLLRHMSRIIDVA